MVCTYIALFYLIDTHSLHCHTDGRAAMLLFFQ